MTSMLKACEGMLKRLNRTIVIDGFGASDIRYSLEYTQKGLYSLNKIDITLGSKNRILGTICMLDLDDMYWVLYSMCNVLDNLRFINGVYEN